MKKYFKLFFISAFIVVGLFSCSGCEEGLSKAGIMDVDLDGDGDYGDRGGEYNPSFKGTSYGACNSRCGCTVYVSDGAGGCSNCRYYGCSANKFGHRH